MICKNYVKENNMLFRLLSILLGFFLIVQNSLALGNTSGFSFSTPIITQDPTNLQGGRVSLWHQPECLIWEHTKIFFDGSLGYWWVSNNSENDKLNIFALAPVLRYY